LEEITGKPLDQLAQELVFEPLEMQNSSFVDSPVVIDNASSGHFPAMALLIVFLFAVSVIFLIFWLLVLIVWRIKNGDWRISRRVTLMVYIASVISVTILVSIMTGGIKPYHIFLIVFTCGALILLMWFADRVLRLIARDRLRLKNLLLVVFFIIIVIGFVAIASIIGDIPNPPVTNVKPSAAGTLRSTAVDMGKFLIELAEPHLLSPDQADQIRSPQVSLSSDLSWGLGPGIQHSQDGDALWQWGQTLDFQSVMIIYPDLGFGVVVLTNSDLLNPDVAIDIAHRAIGGKIEGIIGGSHLQFNYQGPFIE
jgi:CubicO group peptidase (beta-lactamase class C family)